MKKIFEGASVISALLLILTTACVFIFNVKNKQAKASQRFKLERKKEKELQQQKQHYEKKISPLQQELEKHKKLDDPLWHYYDPEDQAVKVKPGKYGVDEPPPNPRGY